MIENAGKKQLKEEREKRNKHIVKISNATNLLLRTSFTNEPGKALTQNLIKSLTEIKEKIYGYIFFYCFVLKVII